MQKRVLSLILLISATLITHGQFRQKATLNPPDTNGFYSIKLRPEFTKYSKKNLADIRIVDDQNKQVPFIWQTYSVNISPSAYINVPIISTSTDTNQTSVELNLQAIEGTNQLDLAIANTNVIRAASLSGSNDRKNWFIISDNILLSGSSTDSSTHYVQTIQFPYSKYEYLKLIVDNGKSDPVNIIRSGIKKDSSATAKVIYTPNPGIKFLQNDSAKETILAISNPESHLVERMSLRVSGTRFYHRDGFVYDDQDHLLATFQLRSDQPSTVTISSNKSKQFKIIIENGDNPPLKTDAVRAEQVTRHMIAFLEPGRMYQLMTGDSNLLAASYDLTRFTDSIPAIVPELTHSDVMPNEVKETRTASYQDYWIWPFIVIMIVLLGYLSIRLIKEMKAKEA